MLVWLNARPRRRAQQLAGARRHFGERSHYLGDDTVLSGNQSLAEIADSAQAWWQLDLDTMGRWQVDRVVGMKAEPYPLIGDVVTLKAPVEQRARCVEQLRIQPSHDDAPQCPGLF